MPRIPTMGGNKFFEFDTIGDPEKKYFKYFDPTHDWFNVSYPTEFLNEFNQKVNENTPESEIPDILKGLWKKYFEPTPEPTPAPAPQPPPGETPPPTAPVPIESPPKAPVPERAYKTWKYYPTPQYKPAYEAFDKPFPIPQGVPYQTPQGLQDYVSTLTPLIRERLLNPPGLAGKTQIEQRTRQAIANQTKKSQEQLNRQYAARGLTQSGLALGAQERLQDEAINAMSNAQREIEIADAKAKEQQFNQAFQQYGNIIDKQIADQIQQYRAKLQAAHDIQQALVLGYGVNRDEWTKVYQSITGEALRHTAYEEAAYKQRYAEEAAKKAYDIAERTGQWQFWGNIIGGILKAISSSGILKSFFKVK